MSQKLLFNLSAATLPHSNLDDQEQTDKNQNSPRVESKISYVAVRIIYVVDFITISFYMLYNYFYLHHYCQ